jgi:hypothetical protein
MKNNSSNPLRDIGLIFIFFTLVGVYFRFDDMKWIFTDISKYQTTSGVITKSEIGYAYRSWRFYIEYKFTIKNIEYTSSRIHFGFQGSTDKRYSTGYLEKYPVGSSVLVYYNTEYPSDSVLEPNVKEFQQFYIFGATMLLSIGLLYLSRKYKSIDS